MKCINCNKVIDEFNTKKRKFCSNKCKYLMDLKKRSKKPEIKNCQYCKKEFKPYTSLDKFCSANCRIDNVKSKRKYRHSQNTVNNRMGSKNPAYKHGERMFQRQRSAEGLRKFQKNRKEYLDEIINNYGYLFCQECGVTNTKLEAHHIIYRSEKPNHENLHDKQNILLLCVKCHNKYHDNKSLRNDIVVNRGLHLIFGNDVLDK